MESLRTSTTTALYSCTACGLLIANESVWTDKGQFHPSCVQSSPGMTNTVYAIDINTTNHLNSIINSLKEQVEALTVKNKQLITEAIVAERERIAQFLERKALSFRNAIKENSDRDDVGALKWLAREYENSAKLIRNGKAY